MEYIFWLVWLLLELIWLTICLIAESKEGAAGERLRIARASLGLGDATHPPEEPWNG